MRMDTAVALVEAYLRVNGYFTLAEYPIVEEMRGERHRSLTDVDIVAVRFPDAGHIPPVQGRRTVDPELHQPDERLRANTESVDMIIGEVKEGAGRLNSGMRDPVVLRATLIRFGCCRIEESDRVISELLEHGTSSTAAGHQIRMVVFASSLDGSEPHSFEFLPLMHLIDYLQTHVAQHWQRLRHTQLKDPVLALLVTLEKARRGATRSTGLSKPDSPKKLGV